MIVQFYISDTFCENFLPFFLFRNCLKKLFEENKYIFELIHDLKDLKDDTDNIIISNIYSINILEINFGL